MQQIGNGMLNIDCPPPKLSPSDCNAQKDCLKAVEVVVQLKLCLRKQKDDHGQQSRELEKSKQEIEELKESYAFGDAALFFDSTRKRVHAFIPTSISDYESRYGVPLKVLLDHLEFTMFHKILTWKADVENFKDVGDGKKLMENYAGLFGKIYPHFGIDSNDALMKNKHFSAIYAKWKEYHGLASTAKLKSMERR